MPHPHNLTAKAVKEYELKLINLGLQPLTGNSAAVRARQEIERAIAAKVIEAAIAAGHTVDVNDGEETTLKNSKDLKAILNAMFTTDEDRLSIRKNDGNEYHSKILGWVLFIYGNCGYDVMSDWTTNLEPIMKDAERLADFYGG